MDTLSHALYGKGFFGYRKYRWTSFLFGALPDLSSFGVYFLGQLFSNFHGLKNGRPSIEEIPIWVVELYNISHSLITAFVFIAIVYFIKKDLTWPMLAWPVHIIVDLFTHSIEFFPTPIFWPLSNYRFDGIPWSNIYVFTINIILIFLIFIYRFKGNTKP